MTNKSIRDYINLIENAQREGVAEGFLGDREYNRVMPFVKRIAGEVSDYDRDEFGEELWSLLDQKYGSKFAQSVLDDLDFYWDTYTELTGQGLDEASVYKKDQDLSGVSTQELEAFVRKHWFGGIPTYGQGESVKRAMRELKRRQKQGVAEGIGNFAKAIGNLHGWGQVNSNNPDVEIYEFDDREGGFYAEGTVYHNTKTGRVKIEFEDKMGEYGGMNVNDTFNSIGDAMNVLRQITIPIRQNTGKAQNFDRLGGREVAGPNDVYKTDRAGKKGTLTKSRMDTMKMSSPYRKTGPKGVLPEQGVAEDQLEETTPEAIAKIEQLTRK